MTNREEIANTIFEQLGGFSAVNAMIGVKAATHTTVDRVANTIDVEGAVPPSHDDVCLFISFRAKARKMAGKAPNQIAITYVSSHDTYTVSFLRLWGINIYTLGVVNDVHAGELRDVIEDKTGLALSLGK